LLEFPHVLVA